MVPLPQHDPASAHTNEELVTKLAHELRPHLANLKSLASMIKEGESNELIMSYFETSLGKLDASIIDILDFVWQMEQESEIP